MRWIRDRSLGLLFAVLSLATWAAQLVVQWFEFVDDQQAHDQARRLLVERLLGHVLAGDARELAVRVPAGGSFVIAAGYLVYKGSSESPDGDERMEAKLDALLEQAGIAPSEIHRKLPAKYQPKVGAKGG